MSTISRARYESAATKFSQDNPRQFEKYFSRHLLQTLVNAMLTSLPTVTAASSMEDRTFEGEVRLWVNRGNSSGYGFILFSHGGPQLDRVFYSHGDITPDALGRRTHGRIVASPVRFKLTKYLYHGAPSAKATDVQSIFSTENIQDHREVSVVEHILKGSHQPIASVFLKRSSSDKLYLGLADVADDHKDRFENIRVGDHVWHVAPPLGNQRTWRAAAAELYSAEKEAAMREQESSRCQDAKV